MNPVEILRRLRRLLLGFASLLFVGTLAELWLTDHMEDFVQLIPFALCGAGLLAVFLVLVRPRRATVRGLRACMFFVVLGSLFGVYQHVWNNIAFQREIDPGASGAAVVRAALGGANPLLAPGILAMAAMLALAATYHYTDARDGDEQASD